MKVVSAFLDYLYKDNLPATKDVDLICGLLYLSDKYNVPKLKSDAEELACSAVNIDNAATLLLLADRHSCKELELVTIHLLAKNIGRVMDTSSWKNMVKERPQLMEKVLAVVAQEKQSDEYPWYINAFTYAFHKATGW